MLDRKRVHSATTHALRWLTRDVERIGSGFVRLTLHDQRLDALRRDQTAAGIFERMDAVLR